MEPIPVEITQELKDRAPGMVLGVIQCEVQNSSFHTELWKEIERITLDVRKNQTFESIKDQPQIAATRAVYAACGKEPSRYRPSAEALMRRIVKGQDLYQINTLVDLVNLVSLKTGFSIGAFDASYIVGDVKASIGWENEPYEGIGKGLINIHNLPVLRDSKGAFGTPTSDEVRTAIRIETTHLLMNINGYGGIAAVTDALNYAVLLLKDVAEAKKILTSIIN